MDIVRGDVVHDCVLIIIGLVFAGNVGVEERADEGKVGWLVCTFDGDDGGDDEFFS
mgnify:CR=1 FL=1